MTAFARVLLVLPLLLITAGSPPAGGQTSRPAVADSPDLMVAGTRDVLWIARVQQRSTRVFQRTPTSAFDLGRPFSDRVVRMTPLGSDLFVFAEDGSPYRYEQEGLEPIPERILPAATIPFDMVGGDQEILALVPRGVADALDGRGDVAPTTPSDDDAPPTVLRYDLRDWTVVANCPDALRGARQVHIGLAQDRIILVWLTAAGEVQTANRLRTADAEWTAPFTLPGDPCRRFFLASADKHVTILTIPERGGDPEVFRLLGSLRVEGNDAWRSGVLQWSPLPEGVSKPAYTAATGFNQHLAVLTATAEGTLLRFARIDAAVAEETIDVEAVLSEPAAQHMAQRLFVTVTLLLLLIVLVGLFAFRRESMIQPVVLAPGYALAPISARLLAWLIDFVPFAVAAGLMLEIPFSLAMRTLFAWGFSPEQNELATNQTMLLWWGLSIGGFTTYAMIMELITGRTVGKVLTGTRVFSERGDSPSLGQIVARNLMRLLELLPHFWVFGLLVVLSRNQQRLGDVFARTYVAKRIPLLVMIDDDQDDDASDKDE